MWPYALRVDIIGETTYDRMTKFLALYDKYLVSEEVGDETGKLHLQGIVWIEPDTKSYNALRKRWNDHYPTDTWPAKGKCGNKKALATVKNVDSYQSYICKQENIKYIKNYSKEEINLFIEESKKIKDKKDESKKLTKSQEFRNIVLEKFDTFYSRLHNEPYVYKGVTYRRELCRDAIKAWLIDTFYCLEQLWDTPVVTKYTNLLHYRIAPQEHKDQFIAATRDRW